MHLYFSKRVLIMKKTDNQLDFYINHFSCCYVQNLFSVIRDKAGHRFHPSDRELSAALKSARNIIVFNYRPTNCVTNGCTQLLQSPTVECIEQVMHNYTLLSRLTCKKLEPNLNYLPFLACFTCITIPLCYSSSAFLF